MFEVKGDLWTLPAKVIFITTNGTVKKNGEAVMGRGCALEAKKKYSGIEFDLGRHIKKFGNRVTRLVNGYDENPHILSFPVKHNWWEVADLDLIARSCIQAQEMMDHFAGPNDFIALPRPGCGNGQLEWEDVKPICEKFLDNRFGLVFK
jgi:hypothetical protein